MPREGCRRVGETEEKPRTPRQSALTSPIPILTHTLRLTIHTALSIPEPRRASQVSLVLYTYCCCRVNQRHRPLQGLVSREREQPDIPGRSRRGRRIVAGGEGRPRFARVRDGPQRARRAKGMARAPFRTVELVQMRSPRGCYRW